MQECRQGRPTSGLALVCAAAAIASVVLACGGVEATPTGPDATPGASDASPPLDSGADVTLGPLDGAVGADGGRDAPTAQGPDGSDLEDATTTPESSVPHDGGYVIDSGPPCADAGSTLVLPFASFPQLQQAGGSARVAAAGYKDPDCFQPQIIVVAVKAGSYVAFAGSDPFLCCLLEFDGTDLRDVCNATTFDLTGKCIVGSAQSLPQLPVCSDGAAVYVGF